MNCHKALRCSNRHSLIALFDLDRTDVPEPGSGEPHHWLRRWLVSGVVGGGRSPRQTAIRWRSVRRAALVGGKAIEMEAALSFSKELCRGAP
jgi:hypothetical protein